MLNENITIFRNKETSNRSKMRFAETLGIHITPEWKSVFINYEVITSYQRKSVEENFYKMTKNFPDISAHVRVFSKLTEMEIAVCCDFVNSFLYDCMKTM